MTPNYIFHHKVIKIIALTMAFIFPATSIAPAQSISQTIAPSSLAKKTIQTPEQTFQEILKNVPNEIGTLKEISRGTARRTPAPFVIHIQDAHANPDAQQNIFRMLKYFSTHFGNDVGAIHESPLRIAVEGAKGALHPEYYDFFPEYPEAGEAMIKDLLEKGELTGAELFAWEEYKKQKQEARNKRQENNVSSPRKRGSMDPRFRGDDMKVIGVEDIGFYRDNLHTYQTLLARRGEFKPRLDQVRSQLFTEQSKVLNRELIHFIKERDRRKEGKYTFGRASGNGNFSTYLDYLRTQAGKTLEIDLIDPIEQLRFPNLIRILLIKKAEGEFDHEKAASEWGKVLKLVREKAKGGPEKAFAESLDLFGRKNGFFGNTSDITTAQNLNGLYPRQLLEKLYSFTQKKKIDLSSFKQFIVSFRLAVFQAEIDAAELMTEIDGLERALIEKLSKTEAEKAFLRKLENFALLEKLLYLELSRGDYEQVLSRKEELRVIASPEGAKQSGFSAIKIGGSATNFGGKKQIASSSRQGGTPRNDELGQVFEKSLHFYDIARKRDQALVTNALELTNVSSPNEVNLSSPRKRGSIDSMDSRFRRADRSVPDVQAAVSRLINRRGNDTKKERSIIVLITGGFHSEGIKETLKEQGVPFAEYSPRINSLDDGNRYERVMSEANADLTQYFKVKNPFRTKQEAILLKEALEVSVPVIPKHYQIPTQELVGKIQNAMSNHEVLRESLTANLYGTKQQPFIRLIPRLNRSAFPVAAAVSAVPNSAHPSFIKGLLDREPSPARGFAEIGFNNPYGRPTINNVRFSGQFEAPYGTFSSGPIEDLKQNPNRVSVGGRSESRSINLKRSGNILEIGGRRFSLSDLMNRRSPEKGKTEAQKEEVVSATPKISLGKIIGNIGEVAKGIIHVVLYFAALGYLAVTAALFVGPLYYRFPEVMGIGMVLLGVMFYREVRPLPEGSHSSFSPRLRRIEESEGGRSEARSTRPEGPRFINGWISSFGLLGTGLAWLGLLIGQSKSSSSYFPTFPFLSSGSSGVMSQPNSNTPKREKPTPIPGNNPNLNKKSEVMDAGTRMVKTLRNVFDSASRRLSPKRDFIRFPKIGDNINKISEIVNKNISRSEARSLSPDQISGFTHPDNGSVYFELAAETFDAVNRDDLVSKLTQALENLGIEFIDVVAFQSDPEAIVTGFFDANTSQPVFNVRKWWRAETIASDLREAVISGSRSEARVDLKGLQRLISQKLVDKGYSYDQVQVRIVKGDESRPEEFDIRLLKPTAVAKSHLEGVAQLIANRFDYKIDRVFSLKKQESPDTVGYAVRISLTQPVSQINQSQRRWFRWQEALIGIVAGPILILAAYGLVNLFKGEPVRQAPKEVGPPHVEEVIEKPLPAPEVKKGVVSKPETKPETEKKEVPQPEAPVAQEPQVLKSFNLTEKINFKGSFHVGGIIRDRVEGIERMVQDPERGKRVMRFSYNVTEPGAIVGMYFQRFPEDFQPDNFNSLRIWHKGDAKSITVQIKGTQGEQTDIPVVGVGSNWQSTVEPLREIDFKIREVTIIVAHDDVGPNKEGAIFVDIDFVQVAGSRSEARDQKKISWSRVLGWGLIPAALTLALILWKGPEKVVIEKAPPAKEVIQKELPTPVVKQVEPAVEEIQPQPEPELVEAEKSPASERAPPSEVSKKVSPPTSVVVDVDLAEGLPDLSKVLAPEEKTYLFELEKETFKGLFKLIDPASGWLVDYTSVETGDVVIEYGTDGTKTSPTNIGLGAVGIILARDNGYDSKDETQKKIDKLLSTLEKVEKHHGFFYNWYGLTGRRGETPKVTLNRFVSSVDNGNLTAALIAIIEAFPGADLAKRAQALLDAQDYNFFYNKNPNDSRSRLINHGYDQAEGRFSQYDYGILNTEARLTALIAILKDNVPRSVWDKQNKLVKVYTTRDGKEIPHVAAWSGSLFEALFADEFLAGFSFGPLGWGVNSSRMVLIHMDRGARISPSGVWGFSPGQVPGTGGKYEAAGIPEASYNRFPGKFVTLYSPLLSLRYHPKASISNLKRAEKLNPKVRNPNYGFTDSIDPETGTINENILGLDKGMEAQVLGNVTLAIKSGENFSGIPRYFWSYFSPDKAKLGQSILKESETLPQFQTKVTASEQKQTKGTTVSGKKAVEKTFSFIKPPQGVRRNLGAFYTPGQAFARENFRQDKEKGQVLAMTYNVSRPNSFSGLYIKINPKEDFSKYDGFRVLLRGVKSKGYPETVKFELKSAGSFALVEHVSVSDKWEETIVRIPPGIGEIDEATLVFENSAAGSHMRGEIEIAAFEAVGSKPSIESPRSVEPKKESLESPAPISQPSKVSSDVKPSDLAKTLPLNETGYLKVAETGDVNAMKIYIRRIAKEMNLKITNEGDLSGFAPWYADSVPGVENPEPGKGAQSLRRMKEELEAAKGKWISPRSEARASQVWPGFSQEDAERLYRSTRFNADKSDRHWNRKGRKKNEERESMQISSGGATMVGDAGIFDRTIAETSFDDLTLGLQLSRIHTDPEISQEIRNQARQYLFDLLRKKPVKQEAVQFVREHTVPRSEAREEMKVRGKRKEGRGEDFSTASSDLSFSSSLSPLPFSLSSLRSEAREELQIKVSRRQILGAGVAGLIGFTALGIMMGQGFDATEADVQPEQPEVEKPETAEDLEENLTLVYQKVISENESIRQARLQEFIQWQYLYSRGFEAIDDGWITGISGYLFDGKTSYENFSKEFNQEQLASLAKESKLKQIPVKQESKSQRAKRVEELVKKRDAFVKVRDVKDGNAEPMAAFMKAHFEANQYKVAGEQNVDQNPWFLGLVNAYLNNPGQTFVLFQIEFNAKDGKLIRRSEARMLVLGRKPSEEIRIGDDTLVEFDGFTKDGAVKLNIFTPDNVYTEDEFNQRIKRGLSLAPPEIEKEYKLTLKPNEKAIIGNSFRLRDNHVLKIVRILGNTIRLGIETDPTIQILRTELEEVLPGRSEARDESRGEESGKRVEENLLPLTSRLSPESIRSEAHSTRPSASLRAGAESKGEGPSVQSRAEARELMKVGEDMIGINNFGMGMAGFLIENLVINTVYNPENDQIEVAIKGRIITLAEDKIHQILTISTRGSLQEAQQLHNEVVAEANRYERNNRFDRLTDAERKRIRKDPENSASDTSISKVITQIGRKYRGEEGYQITRERRSEARTVVYPEELQSKYDDNIGRLIEEYPQLSVPLVSLQKRLEGFAVHDANQVMGMGIRRDWGDQAIVKLREAFESLEGELREKIIKGNLIGGHWQHYAVIPPDGNIDESRHGLIIWHIYYQRPEWPRELKIAIATASIGIGAFDGIPPATIDFDPWGFAAIALTLSRSEARGKEEEARRVKGEDLPSSFLPHASRSAEGTSRAEARQQVYQAAYNASATHRKIMDNIWAQESKTYGTAGIENSILVRDSTARRGALNVKILEEKPSLIPHVNVYRVEYEAIKSRDRRTIDVLVNDGYGTPEEQIKGFIKARDPEANLEALGLKILRRDRPSLVNDARSETRAESRKQISRVVRAEARGQLVLSRLLGEETYIAGRMYVKPIAIKKDIATFEIGFLKSNEKFRRTRMVNETFTVHPLGPENKPVRIMFIGSHRGRIRLGFDADRSVDIVRHDAQIQQPKAQTLRDYLARRSTVTRAETRDNPQTLGQNDPESTNVTVHEGDEFPIRFKTPPVKPIVFDFLPTVRFIGGKRSKLAGQTVNEDFLSSELKAAISLVAKDLAGIFYVSSVEAYSNASHEEVVIWVTNRILELIDASGVSGAAIEPGISKVVSEALGTYASSVLTPAKPVHMVEGITNPSEFKPEDYFSRIIPLLMTTAKGEKGKLTFVVASNDPTLLKKIETEFEAFAAGKMKVNIARAFNVYGYGEGASARTIAKTYQRIVSQDPKSTFAFSGEDKADLETVPVMPEVYRIATGSVRRDLAAVIIPTLAANLRNELRYQVQDLTSLMSQAGVDLNDITAHVTQMLAAVRKAAVSA